jgi:hypothetical protein
VVSQRRVGEGNFSIEGTTRMVDASASYGASGGGVFDVDTGALIGIVEGYRLAQMSSGPPGPRTPAFWWRARSLVIPD